MTTKDLQLQVESCYKYSNIQVKVHDQSSDKPDMTNESSEKQSVGCCTSELAMRKAKQGNVDRIT